MLNVGIIGCGYIAGKHISSIARIDGMELTAVSDINQDTMKKTVAAYQSQVGKRAIISCHEKYENLLEDPKIDVVVVALLSSLHATVAKNALIKGKHVILEKPISLSLKEADELIALEKSYKRKVLVCHQLRYRPLLQKVKEKMVEGKFGKPYLGVISLRLYRPPGYYENSNWKGTWEKDGGMLVNQGIHMVDQLLWMMGSVRSAYGEIGRALLKKETEDFAAGIMRFNNGSRGIIEANTITIPKNLGYELTVFGDKGSISIGGRQFNEVTHCYMENEKEIEEITALTNDMNEHYYMYEDMQQAILKDQKPAVSLSVGKQALEAIFALYRAAQENSVVSLPLKDFNTKEMEER